MDITQLPFNSLIGVQTKSLDSGTRVFLVPTDKHLNHLKTVHATVIYGIAEASSGNELIHRFPFLADGYLAVLRDSTTKYRMPGEPGIEITGIPTVDIEAVEQFQNRLKNKGRATLEIDIEVLQQENKLLEGRFKWYVQLIGD